MLRFFSQNRVLLGELEIEPKLNLLAHAQILELDTGSECGGHGICIKDRMRIDPAMQKQNLNPPTEIERRKLKAAELNQGIRLACQAFPNPGCIRLEVTCLAGAKAQI